MTAELILLGPLQGRGFWTGLSLGLIKVESGVADFSVFESSPPATGPLPPLHIHRHYDEAWYVLDGTIEFSLDGRQDRRTVGSFVFVPRGVAHSFANPGPGPSRILVIGSPQVAAMVEEVGRQAGLGPEHADKLVEVLRRYDTDVVQN